MSGVPGILRLPFCGADLQERTRATAGKRGSRVPGSVPLKQFLSYAELC